MFRVTKFSKSFIQQKQLLNYAAAARLSGLSSLVDIKTDVYDALKTNKKAVVALESTIITHGMPYPFNLNTAIEVENIVRQQGAVPATIAIINGRIKVGLTVDEIELLADVEKNISVKTSRRDLAYVLSKNWNGGTTVAGTLIIANMVGIKVFATGGIGGVHRDGQNTLDVSADLVELGRSPVAVVSSGIKSILDIPRTMEYLETQGVFVASYKSENNDFPAFYTKSSGTKAPYNITSSKDAAKMILASAELKMGSGFLIGVPIPDEFAMDSNLINKAIEDALKRADENGIKGKEVTPFILSAVSKITKGSSLESNMALIKNNAKVAAQIAVDLNNLINNNDESDSDKSDNEVKENVPVVIGGSIVDTCITVVDDNLKLDGATYNAKLEILAGGVGRNIAESLYKIHGDVNLISAVGDDQHGQFIKKMLPKHCGSSIATSGVHPTANCAVILDKFGDCKLVVGDMSVHNTISSSWIKSNVKLIKSSPLVIVDANLPIETLETVFEICKDLKKPVFFEPTDMRFATKAFEAKNKEVIKFISPNIFELREIAKVLGCKKINSGSFEDHKTILKEAQQLAEFVNSFVDNIIVTLGEMGVGIMRNNRSSDGIFFTKKGEYLKEYSESSFKFYAAHRVENVVNVSGAGDSFTSGFISAMLKGLPEDVCVNVGFEAARCALLSKGPVANRYFDGKHVCWKQGVNYVPY